MLFFLIDSKYGPEAVVAVHIVSDWLQRKSISRDLAVGRGAACASTGVSAGREVDPLLSLGDSQHEVICHFH